MAAYDFAIIGGGFIGVALAYELARRGASVVLLERDHLGSGSSGGGAGRAQVGEAHPGLHLDIVIRGLARLEQLEAELACAFDWQRVSNTMLIRGEDSWRQWSAQVALLRSRGLRAEMLDPSGIRAAEPALCPDGYLGAAWCEEGHVNPFRYLQAYAAAARRAGAVLCHQLEVTGFVTSEGPVLSHQGQVPHQREHERRFVAATTPDGPVAAGAFIVAGGAWTRPLLALAGCDAPVRFTQNEALITEVLPPTLGGHVGLADFYGAAHGPCRAVTPGATRQGNGTLLITGAVDAEPVVPRRSTAWGPPALAREFLKLCPSLDRARVVRSWAALSPHAPDANPIVGALPGAANLYVAAAFHLCITTTPVLTDLFARSLLREAVTPSLAEYNPVRFLS